MQSNSPVQGGPLIFLRVESFLIFCIFSLFAVKLSPLPLWGTLMLFFAPDISFLGYVFGSRVGALFYNSLHSYVGPLLLFILPLMGQVLEGHGGDLSLNVLGPSSYLSFLWAGHVGFDRMLGFGLKYSQGFGYTHLGWLEKWVNKGTTHPRPSR